MKERQNITYIQAPDEKLFPDDDVAELVNILNNVERTNSGVRHRLALALGKKPDADRAIREIDPSHWAIMQMRAFRDQGNTIIAKDGEKTVGMIGFEEFPPTPSGQRLFAIRRTTVLPEYRGGGIGRELRESIIKRLQGIDADAILLSWIHKANTVNQNLAASTGSQRFPTGR